MGVGQKLAVMEVLSTPPFFLEKKGAVDGTKENLAGDRSPCTPRPLLRGTAVPLTLRQTPWGTGDGEFFIPNTMLCHPEERKRREDLNRRHFYGNAVSTFGACDLTGEPVLP